jgi:hypothetical protein
VSAGIGSAISFAKESTWGVAVTPTKSLQVRPTGSLDVKENIQLIPGIRSGLNKNYNAIKGKVEYSGDLTFDAFGDYLGHFMLSAFGVDTPALHSGETIVYDHVFTEAATKPSLTIETSIGENCRRFAGSIVKQLKFSGKTGEMVEVVASILAKTQASSTAITPAFTTIPAFNHTQVAVKIGGSTLTEVEDFELNYNNNQEFVYALGSSDPSFNAANGSEVNGKLTLYLDSTTITQFTNYLNNTQTSLEIICTGTTIGSAANYVLDLLIPKASFITAVTKITDKHNMLEISYDSIYDTVTSALIKPTLTNLLATIS